VALGDGRLAGLGGGAGGGIDSDAADREGVVLRRGRSSGHRGQSQTDDQQSPDEHRPGNCKASRMKYVRHN
jgi:hypothetical protein